MAEKKTQIVIRESKENIFNALKVIAPGLFGDKVYEDVVTFTDDSLDSSYLEIRFKED